MRFERYLIALTLSVVNKSGGGGSIAYTCVQQHSGNPHPNSSPIFVTP